MNTYRIALALLLLTLTNNGYTVTEQYFRGQLLVSEKKSVLTLCGEKKQRAIVLGTKAQTMLNALGNTNANTTNNQSFFIEAWGTQFKDGSLRLNRIERASLEQDNCNEKLSGFIAKAHGTEPFWAITISQHTLNFQRPDHPNYSGSYNHKFLADGARRFETNSEQGLFTVTFTPQICRDGMSDTVFGWTAKVRMNEKTWQGCGYFGNLGT